MIDQVIIIVYLLVMLSVGLYFARKQKTQDSFFLASRNLGIFHVVASIFSTVSGAGTVFMVAALGYTYGISAIWFFISSFVGFIIFSLAVPKIKQIADEHDCITLPELLIVKLDRKSMILASLVTIAIFGGFVAVNFLAAGKILKIVFDVPLAPIVVGFAVVVTLYSLLGGFKAVVWTDIIQMFIIIFGVSLVLILAINSAGGVGAINSLPETHKDPIGMGLPLIIGMFLSTFLSYFSSQDIYQRMFAAKSQTTAKRSVVLMGILLVLGGSVVMFLGVFGRILFPDILAGEVIPTLTKNLVPVGLTGFVLAAYLAMANSTADSELLTVTSNIMRDFFGRKRRLTPKQEVTASRIIVILVAIVALVFALTTRNIIHMVLSMYTWLGILGINVIATLFWKRTTANAVFWSLVIGFASAIMYAFTTRDFETSMIVGLIPSIIVLVTVSLFSNKHSILKK